MVKFLMKIKNGHGEKESGENEETRVDNDVVFENFADCFANFFTRAYIMTMNLEFHATGNSPPTTMSWKKE